MKKYLYILTFTIIGTLIISCNDKSKTKGVDDPDTILTDTLHHRFQYGVRIDTLDIEEFKIKDGDNLSAIFNRMGFSPRMSDSIVQASKEILEPKRLRAGNEYVTLSTQDTCSQILYIVFEKSHTDFSVIDLTSNMIKAYEFNKEIITKTYYTEGEINSSLWAAIVDNDGDPLLSLKLSDIYAWQIDFFDVKKGDSFKVLYDVAYIDDSIPLSIGDIKGAIFKHQNKEFLAVPFEQDSVLEFFDEEGNSLRKAFLKAPLNFHRISSRFSNARYHPVLKRYRAHHGVDYAAPAGTPVKTIGDGKVIAKAYQANGGGYYMKVKHNSVYTTTYMHLKGFAKGIEVGSHVQQGQVIAYVGSTGLSTGPHLDFRVHKNGTPIDPLNMESPPSLPVKPELLEQYNQVKESLLNDIVIHSKDFNSKKQDKE